MTTKMTFTALFIVVLATVAMINAQQPLHKRFEYKHSFRAPKLAQPDGTVPFWEITGDAIASAEQLRLVPSMRSRKGAIWNKKPFAEEFWEVELTMKISGQGRIGADGLALWYTAQQGSLGTVFGSSDYWTGLGILFDSFDNDNQRNNPYVMAMINDGTRSYDHQTDGSGQMLAGCQKDFRNRLFPVKVKVTYSKNVLTVMIHDGMTQVDRYELCLRAENIFLPRNGYFGISAATGGLADDHDVSGFSAYSLLSEAPAQPGSVPDKEKEKFDEEFEKMWSDFESEKEKFRKEHPDRVNEDSLEAIAKNFEDSTARELRQIYESQNGIHQVLVQLDAKLVAIQQTQTQHGPLLQQAARSTGQVAQPVAGQGQPPPAVGGGGDGMARHEVNELMQSIREVSTTIKEVKTYVNDVYTRTYQMENKLNTMQANQGNNAAQVQHQQPPVGGSADQASLHLIQQLQNTLAQVQQDVQHVRATAGNAPAAQRGVPNAAMDCPTCLSNSIFYMVIAAQSVLLVAVTYFKKGQDKAKFY